VPLWLNSAVSAIKIAGRAGVAILPKVYTHCIGGQADAANRRITDALLAQDAGPGVEQTATASRHLEPRSDCPAVQWPRSARQRLVSVHHRYSAGVSH
jgi:hypothetical protein